MSQLTLLNAPRYPMALTGTPGAVTCRVEFTLGRNAKQIDSIRWMLRDRIGETIHADRKRTFIQNLPSGHYSVQLTIQYTDQTKSVEVQSFDVVRTTRGPVLRMHATKTPAAAAALKAATPSVSEPATADSLAEITVGRRERNGTRLIDLKVRKIPGRTIGAVQWTVREFDMTVASSRRQVFQITSLRSGRYEVKLHVYYADGGKVVEHHRIAVTQDGASVEPLVTPKVVAIEVDKSTPTPGAPATRLMNAASPEAQVKVKVGTKTVTKKAQDLKVGDKLAPVRKNKAFTAAQAHAEAIVAFEKNVKALEGVTVKLTPIVGTDFKGAIKCLYSAQFPHSLQLEGKRPVVRQLIARLAQVVDPAKVHIVVVDDAGNAVSPSTTLAKLRG